MPEKAETETIITWTSADEFATVYTMHKKILGRCLRLGAKEINHDHGIRDGKKVSWTFLVPIDCVSIRPARKGRVLSAEERQRARERFLKSNPRAAGKSDG